MKESWDFQKVIYHRKMKNTSMKKNCELKNNAWANNLVNIKCTSKNSFALFWKILMAILYQNLKYTQNKENNESVLAF